MSVFTSELGYCVRLVYDFTIADLSNWVYSNNPILVAIPGFRNRTEAPILMLVII